MMKAGVLEKIGTLTYKDVETPAPRKGEVLLRIRAAGICGSDLDRVYQKGTYSMPMIPGHEFAGEIVAAGDAEMEALVGKKAAVFPLLPCKTCDMCEVGQYASCRNYDYFGSRRDGGFAEYVAVPAWNLVLAEGELSFEEMAMAEPAAVSLHALNRARVGLMDTVAVFGAGAIGLMLCEFAIAMGCGTVIVMDVDPRKIQFAQGLGFRHALNNAKGGWEEQVMELTGGKGVDIAIDGAGVSAALAGCLQIAKPQGDVVLMGNPAGDVHLSKNDYWQILRKQLNVRGTWNSDFTQQKNEWQIAIRAMAQKKLDVKKLITHRFDLSECGQAFEMAKCKEEFSCRIMFVDNLL